MKVYRNLEDITREEDSPVKAKPTSSNEQPVLRPINSLYQQRLTHYNPFTYDYEDEVEVEEDEPKPRRKTSKSLVIQSLRF